MTERQVALERLKALGLRGADVYLAELIPAIEMAWADGVVQPNEQALLEAYCESLVKQLNEQAGARLFDLGRALRRLHTFLSRRLTPSERHTALEALRLLSTGQQTMRRRIAQWCEAVAAVDGSPVWDARELFWLQRVRTSLELA